MATDVIVCHCCSEPPQLRPGASLTRLVWHCACPLAGERDRHQAWEIEKLLELVRRKNLELDALHFVWCDGACESSTHRHSGELTQAVVDEAVRNTERLRRRWDGMQRKASDALDAAEEREAVTR